MVNSEKNFALGATSKIYIRTLVLSEKNTSERNEKHNPPPSS